LKVAQYFIVTVYFENFLKQRVRKLFYKYMFKRKQILFGKFDNTLTMEKIAGWQDLHKFALGLGYHKKEWQYILVRDAFWPNIRQTIMVSGPSDKFFFPKHVVVISVCRRKSMLRKRLELAEGRMQN
jgi:hypothetical protein